MADGPLAGQRVVITRMSQQGGRLRRLVRELGGLDVSVPLMELADPSDGGVALAAEVDDLGRFDWVVATSPNGADALCGAIRTARNLGGDAPVTLAPTNRATTDGAAAPSGSELRVAAIGPGTADRLARHGVRVDFVPDRSVGEGLVEEFPAPDHHGQRVLVVQGEAARPVVRDGLAAAGFDVTAVGAYRTIDAQISDEQRALIADADVITFTSSSTVERFCDLVGLDYLPPQVASIGPITSATAAERGIEVTAEAEAHTVDGLIEALEGLARKH